jgi:hypothetical protein
MNCDAAAALANAAEIANVQQPKVLMLISHFSHFAAL